MKKDANKQLIFHNPTKALAIEKRLAGEDGHKVFSVRITDATVQHIEEIAKETGRSRNELINSLLDFALLHVEIVEK